MKRYILAFLPVLLLPFSLGLAEECVGDKCGTLMRVDCRYHNVESLPGVNFCYASAVYRAYDHNIFDIKFGIGCDNQTLFNDRARYTPVETTLDRLSPLTAATPAIELKPQFALFTPGVYESTADVLNFGRMDGRCYVITLTHHHGYESLDLPLD